MQNQYHLSLPPTPVSAVLPARSGDSVMVRGRPRKSLLERALEEDASKAVAEFGRRPLRQPVDADFSPYCQRFLRTDLSALSDYLYSKDRLDDSFYELLGRLSLRFPRLGDWIIAAIEARGGDDLIMPPDWVVYPEWYEDLSACARELVNSFKANTRQRTR